MCARAWPAGPDLGSPPAPPLAAPAGQAQEPAARQAAAAFEVDFKGPPTPCGLGVAAARREAQASGRAGSAAPLRVHEPGAARR
eukprot:CAMPEP_0204593652 /NCGR_PEP_ID=MMETSP0661-20131031/51633_1 /ASSEMBLY_ACC=CAM_ASM_000606 /TAXON_ID=109239 /ORGANISM="Alexandrium margalefi, Strain AMGDE01CS-322" /LENGTH=83 /DNA_ID=CAMNT_0051603977 /DNA_START=12 /DNA_END=260 /DNA_ORIENTATION=+